MAAETLTQRRSLVEMCQTDANYPDTPTARTIDYGVNLGLITNTPETRLELAGNMGVILNAAYPQLGIELFVDDLNLEALARESGIPLSILESSRRLLVATGEMVSIKNKPAVPGGKIALLP